MMYNNLSRTEQASKKKERSPDQYSATSYPSGRSARPPTGYVHSKNAAAYPSGREAAPGAFAVYPSGRSAAALTYPSGRLAAPKPAAAAVDITPLIAINAAPSIFRIKEHFWSFEDTFTIKDDKGVERYQVKGKVFSFGNKLSFQNMRGDELAFISQDMFSFSFLTKYQIRNKDGNLFATMVKEWTFLLKQFTLDVFGDERGTIIATYTIDGSFFSNEFTFTRDGVIVATVSKDYFQFIDTYGVEIVAGEDEVAILSACIIIAQILFKSNDGIE